MKRFMANNNQCIVDLVDVDDDEHENRHVRRPLNFNDVITTPMESDDVRGNEDNGLRVKPSANKKSKEWLNFMEYTKNKTLAYCLHCGEDIKIGK